MYPIHSIIFLIFSFSILSLIDAQTICDGPIPGGTVDSLTVPGTTCLLQGVTVTGSISVTSGGTLTTQGATAIFGSIEATGSGNIFLQGSTTVSGSVLFSDTTARIVVGTNAVITDLSLENAGSAAIRGTSGGVSAKNSGLVRVNGGEVGGGGLLIEQGIGNVILCGATITGSVEMVETTGNLRAVSSGSCPPSTISGSVGVEKGTGDIRLTGVTFASGDLGVVEQTGSVVVRSAVLSDVGISGVDGSIILDGVTTDSDVELKENTGDVTITGTSVQGDVTIEQNEAVTITGSSFGGESVGLKLNSGPVVIEDNTDLSLSVEENDNVEITDNVILVASIVKNTGGVAINGNTFTELSCVDNNPSPTGTDNTAVLPVTGQCSAVIV